MKNLSLLFIAFLIVQFPSLAQEGWFEQTSGTTERLNGVSFTDSDNGTAVGNGGTIIRTIDGGTTWTPQTSGTTELLNGVSFTDSDNGTAVGYDGTIIRTIDGGVTWNSQTSGTTEWLFSVSFTDSDNGTVVGGRGMPPPANQAILRTTDGGATWEYQLSGHGAPLLGVCFTDSDNGTAVGSGGIILKTTTGGVIPVELNSFTASTSQGKVFLNWTTATELNNLGFEIERKIITDREGEWVRIGFSEGYGTTTEQREYSYVDDISTITATSLAYRLKQIDYDGSYEYSDKVLVDNPAPTEFALNQNFPNPYNPATTITYSLPVKAQVELVLYNTLGECITRLVNEEKEAGKYEVEFNASSLPSGVYFYRLQAVPTGRQAGAFVETKKMLLLK